MKRRTALKTIGALGASVAASKLLTGCGSDEAGITTIVALMMENRSYDHFLGARTLLEGLPGDGLVAGMSNRNRAGDEIEIFRTTDNKCIADPPHSWTRSHRQFNSGANDGFVTEYQTRHGDGIPPHVIAYMGREDQPVSWALADQFTTCDRWFCALMGPTWPSRRNGTTSCS